jgi:hypothetical protein
LRFLRRIKQISPKRARFYPQAAGLGKRVATPVAERASPKPRAVAPGLAPQPGRRRMRVFFAELDFRPTPMGVRSQRRRRQLGDAPVRSLIVRAL